LSGAPAHLLPVIFVGCNQKIDAAAASKVISVTVGKSKKNSIPLTAITDMKTILDTPTVSKQLVTPYKDADGKWCAWVPSQPLPHDSSIHVNLPEIPSAEGPLKGSELHFSFTTIPKFGNCWLIDKCIDNDTGCVCNIRANTIVLDFNQELVPKDLTSSIDNLVTSHFL
jgi:hypothetical protein